MSNYETTGFAIIDAPVFSRKTVFQAATTLVVGGIAGRIYKILNLNPIHAAFFAGTQFLFQKIVLQNVRLRADTWKEDDNEGFKLRTFIHILLPAVTTPFITQFFTQYLSNNSIGWAASVSMPLITGVAILASEVVLSIFNPKDELETLEG